MDNKVVAMILAGGKGTRLESLTRKTAKPAVSFAARYRIIDFPLSNCANSGIGTVGVLTQYESNSLNSYIGNGEKWGLNGVHSSMSNLSPRQTEEGSNWYKGTADAISRNIDFLDAQDADYILILSGDHIYKTKYNDLIDLHISRGADATICCIEVPLEDASRFGIMAVDGNDRIIEFQEKPRKPKSNLASMGVYVFTWRVLKRYLKEDMKNEESSHDFGKDIIPAMLNDGRKLIAYRFHGYWRDVGTIASLHQANMDIALNRNLMNLHKEDSETRIYTEDTVSVPQYIGPVGFVQQSIVNQGATIYGRVTRSVISTGVVVEENGVVENCVLMDDVLVQNGAKIKNAIVGPGAIVEAKSEINLDSDEIILVNGR